MPKFGFKSEIFTIQEYILTMIGKISKNNFKLTFCLKC